MGNVGQNVKLRHDSRGVAREASAAPAAWFKRACLHEWSSSRLVGSPETTRNLHPPYLRTIKNPGAKPLDRERFKRMPGQITPLLFQVVFYILGKFNPYCHDVLPDARPLAASAAARLSRTDFEHTRRLGQGQHSDDHIDLQTERSFRTRRESGCLSVLSKSLHSRSL